MIIFWAFLYPFGFALISFIINSFLLYLNLEKIKLNYYNFIFIILLYILLKKKIYFINIRRFKKTTFLIINNNVIFLKIILKILIISKAIFNIYNNLNTLFSYYKIFINGIKNL